MDDRRVRAVVDASRTIDPRASAERALIAVPSANRYYRETIHLEHIRAKTKYKGVVKYNQKGS
jgi:hypothetical protein